MEVPADDGDHEALDVAWNVGKFGTLHPFAELEPVHVGGVTVKLATLHNEEDLARKDVRPGDDVIVLRAGDVIPQVISPAPHVVERTVARPLRAAGALPSCDTPTIKDEGGLHTLPNRDCPGRRWQLLAHFVSRGAMDIDGIGEKQVTALMEHGLVRTAADFYRLTEEQLVELDRFGESLGAQRDGGDRGVEAAALRARAVRARDRGDRRRHRAQHRAALPLDRRAGGRHAEQIADTPGIGPIVGQQIHDQLRDPQMRALIADLRALGLRFEEEGPPPGEGPLAGKALVLTGTLPTLTREQATERILAAGGRVDVERVEEDRLRGRGGGGRVEAGEGGAAGGGGGRRGGARGAAGGRGADGGWRRRGQSAGQRVIRLRAMIRTPLAALAALTLIAVPSRRRDQGQPGEQEAPADREPGLLPRLPDGHVLVARLHGDRHEGHAVGAGARRRRWRRAPARGP